jgi:hypothetical protein
VLKDTLNELLAKESECCKFGTMVKSLDSETKTVLVTLMKNPSISARSIHSALVSEGIQIGRSSIDTVRNCLSGKTQCKCDSVKGFIK